MGKKSILVKEKYKKKYMWIYAIGIKQGIERKYFWHGKQKTQRKTIEWLWNVRNV